MKRFATAFIVTSVATILSFAAEICVAQPEGATTPCAAISIVSSSLTFHPDADRQDGLAAEILVRNDGTTLISNESVAFYLFSLNGTFLKSPPLKRMELSVPAGAVQEMKISPELQDVGLPVSGFVVVGASSGQCASGARQASQSFVIPSQTSAVNSARIIALSAALGLILLVLAIIKFRRGLAKAMGPSEWSFSASAATNFTIAGALLTSVLASSAVPDYPRYLTKPGYLALSLLFGVAVGLAPALYNFCCKPTGPDPANPQSVEFEGSVGLFLLSVALTLWGVFGQLATMSVMFQEFVARKIISPQSVWVEWAIAVGVAVSIVVYSYRSAHYYVCDHPARQAASVREGFSTEMLRSLTSHGAPRWTAF